MVFAIDFPFLSSVGSITWYILMDGYQCPRRKSEIIPDGKQSLKENFGPAPPKPNIFSKRLVQLILVEVSFEEGNVGERSDGTKVSKPYCWNLDQIQLKEVFLETSPAHIYCWSVSERQMQMSSKWKLSLMSHLS